MTITVNEVGLVAADGYDGWLFWLSVDSVWFGSSFCAFDLSVCSCGFASHRVVSSVSPIGLSTSNCWGDQVLLSMIPKLCMLHQSCVAVSPSWKVSLNYPTLTGSLSSGCSKGWQAWMVNLNITILPPFDLVEQEEDLENGQATLDNHYDRVTDLFDHRVCLITLRHVPSISNPAK